MTHNSLGLYKDRLAELASRSSDALPHSFPLLAYDRSERHDSTNVGIGQPRRQLLRRQVVDHVPEALPIHRVEPLGERLPFGFGELAAEAPGRELDERDEGMVPDVHPGLRVRLDGLPEPLDHAEPVFGRQVGLELGQHGGDLGEGRYHERKPLGRANVHHPAHELLELRARTGEEERDQGRASARTFQLN